MRSIANIVFVVVSLPVLAQKQDTVTRSFIPTGVRIGYDVYAGIRNLADNSFNGLEVNADIDFYRYYLTLDAGRWEREFETEEEQYSNSGNYMRAGVDVNFLKKDPEKNMYFIGARYAWGTFSETMTRTTDDAVWGARTESFTNTDSRATWFELTTGLRVKMYKFFWIGYTIRYKFGLNTRGTGELEPHDVPGFGKTFKSTTWGFNYVVLIRLPVRNGK